MSPLWEDLLTAFALLLILEGFLPTVAPRAWMRAMLDAARLGPRGIRVNSIVPGWILTERQRTLWLTPESLEGLDVGTPDGRAVPLAPAARIAAAAVRLALGLGIALPLAMLLGMAVVGRIARPLARLSDWVRDFRVDEPRSMPDLAGAPTEVDELARAFGDMTRRLVAQRHAPARGHRTDRLRCPGNARGADRAGDGLRAARHRAGGARGGRADRPRDGLRNSRPP